jgi:hypothetical protein
MGENVSLSDVSNNPYKLSSAKFRLADKELEGLFLDDVLVQIKLLNQYGESEFADHDDGPKLRKLFNAKYNKMRTAAKREDHLGVIYNYVYEAWREKSGSFTVELTELKASVTSVRACLAPLQGVETIGAVTLRLRCSPSMRNSPEYFLTYRDDKRLLPVLSDLRKLAKANLEVERKSKNSKLKEF